MISAFFLLTSARLDFDDVMEVAMDLKILFVFAEFQILEKKKRISKISHHKLKNSGQSSSIQIADTKKSNHMRVVEGGYGTNLKLQVFR